MIYGLVPHRGGPGSVALTLDWISATDRRRCTAQMKEGEEASRAAVAVLLRVVVLRSEAVN